MIFANSVHLSHSLTLASPSRWALSRNQLIHPHPARLMDMFLLAVVPVVFILTHVQHCRRLPRKHLHVTLGNQSRIPLAFEHALSVIWQLKTTTEFVM